MDAAFESSRVRTRGVLYVHATKRALCSHIEWAISDVLGSRLSLNWELQPVSPGSVRAELTWIGPAGTGARLASAMRPFTQSIFEVVEEPSPSHEGQRFSSTPTLGLFRAQINEAGDILLHENRVRQAIDTALASGEPVEDEIALILGQPWDDELEPFRRGGDGAVRYLHQVV